MDLTKIIDKTKLFIAAKRLKIYKKCKQIGTWIFGAF